jgi:hypothetical protein
MERRDFLTTGAAAVLGAAAIASGGQAAAPLASPTGPAIAPPPQGRPQIATRKLGKTRREVPVLGYGGASLPKIWLNPLSTEDRVKLVRYAYDCGIRYFDTAGNQ